MTGANYGKLMPNIMLRASVQSGFLTDSNRKRWNVVSCLDEIFICLDHWFFGTCAPNKNIYCFLPKYSIVFISKPVLKVLYNILLSNIALNCWSILARSIHFLQTRLCVYFEFNKFSLTFLETISDCSDQTIIVAPVWGQFNLPSETGSRTKTDIYNFLSVTIIVSCVHLEISNYNKNLPK